MYLVQSDVLLLCGVYMAVVTKGGLVGSQPQSLQKRRLKSQITIKIMPVENKNNCVSFPANYFRKCSKTVTSDVISYYMTRRYHHCEQTNFQRFVNGLLTLFIKLYQILSQCALSYNCPSRYLLTSEKHVLEDANVATTIVVNASSQLYESLLIRFAQK